MPEAQNTGGKYGPFDRSIFTKPEYDWWVILNFNPF